jgi:membrane-associated HD superfamily phosphohydrolase
MNDLINRLYKNNTIIYKVLLFLITVIAIVYLFPKGGQFKYDFPQGKPWQYDNLYAPFDFAIQKTPEEIAEEKKELENSSKKYFVVDTSIKTEVLRSFTNQVTNLDSLSTSAIRDIVREGEKLIDKIYLYGFLDDASIDKASRGDVIILRKGNSIDDVPFSRLVQSKDILSFLRTNTEGLQYYKQRLLINYLSSNLRPNVTYDYKFSEKELNERLQGISYAKGKVSKGELIILKGDIVEGRKYNVLKSYEVASSSRIWTKSNYNWIVFGYTILVALALLMLLLFLERYRFETFNDNNKVTFIFFNIFLMIFVQTMVVKYNSDYLYVVPLSILPIVLKAFLMLD